MAETSTSKTWWIAVGAALAVIVLFLGVFAGPSVVGCATNSENFTECVHDRLADIGIMSPRQKDNIAVADTPTTDDSSDSATTAEPAVEAAAEAEAEAKEAAPAEDEQTQEGETADLVIELVRAEPDGSIVASGRSEPEQTVEIYANDTLLGSTESVRPGDWAFVSEKPLPAGSAEITARIPALGQQSTRSFIVVIADNKTDAPLVVASEPGKADEVLQGLEDEQTSSEPQAAADEPVANEETSTQESANEEPSAEEPANEPADEPSVADADEQTEPAAQDDTTQVEDTAQPSSEADQKMAEVDDAVGDVSSLNDQLDALTPAVQPTIDAIEIDSGKNFFAGSGEEDATIRLYVDNQFVKDTTVKNGRWLIQAEGVLKPKSQRVRVDQLAPGTTDVIGRAEVEFVYNGEDEPVGATADGENQTVDVPETDFGIDTDEPVDIATGAQTGTEAPAGDEASTDNTDTDAVSTPDDSADAGVPVMTAESLGDSERFAAGKAIIRRGDNLWTIARRVYGTGYEYVAIYRANSDQIRNPDLIYPGQVFELPVEPIAK